VELGQRAAVGCNVTFFGSREGPCASIAISGRLVLPVPRRGPSPARSMLDADERELVQKLKLRDEAAFSAFVLKYQERVFRLLLRMLGDRAEAEDLAQEVFISIFKSIDGFRGDSLLSTHQVPGATQAPGDRRLRRRR
jgi:hypothetical protein